ncbi:ABC transporter substrate-binding protein [Methylobacterium sp. J-048]|uniref:PhnD/SsuA/transferrin family substrate-binding protein n=1 Tax=Methylobacterium sp. J-048 TaxID=2836635 RepID=UPI001FBAEB8E|nr:PhnD/SsuA/transferrin family substrate-binding protein [Methylobacterium sp. J-048]MCJ2056931.1 ABC transporter substrate-binding protein [Methylobacterium sp. J-048]
MPGVLRRIVALALGVAALLGPVSVASAAERVTIRIGYAGPAAEGGRYVSGPVGVIASERYIERAFADDPAVTVEWSFFKGAGPAVNEALASGQLDFAFMGDLPSLTARAAGLQTRILMATSPRDNLYLVARPNSGIAAIGDVRGRRVAQFAEQKKAAIVYSTKGNDRGLERQSALLVTEAFERTHPDLVGKVVKAVVEAARWSSDESNRDALIAVWAKSGTPASVFRYDLADQELRYRNSPLVDPFFVEQYRVQARQAKAFGLIRRDVDVTGWFEPRYVDQAVRELGLERSWERFGPDGKPLGS